MSTEEPVRAEATRRYNAWREDASTPLCPPSIRTSIFHIVAENGGEEVFDQLKQIHDEAHDDVVKKAVFQSIGWLPTKALKVAALEWASFSGEVKLQDFQYVIYTVATSNNDGGKTTWDWYEANFMRLREKLASNDSNFARLAGTVLAGIGTQEELDHAKEFLEENAAHLPNAERALAQGLEKAALRIEISDRIMSQHVGTTGYWTTLTKKLESFNMLD